MAAVYSNLYIEQGATFTAIVELVDGDGDPLDLGGYSVRSYFRKSYTSSTYHEFSCDVLSPEVDGKIEISLTSAQTSNLKAGRYVYDIEVYTTDGYGDDDVVYRVLEGQLEVSPEVTRA